MVDVGHDRLDGHGRVDAPQFFSGGDRLGQTLPGVVFVEENLPLEVAQFDEIAIDDAHRADARPHQRIGRGAAQGPAAAHHAHGRISRRCPASPSGG